MKNNWEAVSKQSSKLRRTKRTFTELCSLNSVLFLLILIGGPLACSKKNDSSNNTSAAQMKTKYHCPMHPQYTSDKPGDCPICNMRLVPIDSGTPSPVEHKILFYRNPMDPKVTSPVPVKDSMGMDYVPVYADEAMAPSGIPGQASVHMSQDRVQLIGVKTSIAETRDLVKLIRTSARVAYDPALYSAIMEHREAVAASKKNQAGNADHSEESVATVHASRLRLRQMGLADSQIDEIASPTYDAASLLLSRPGDRIWVYADLYADEINLVKRGQTVDLTAPAFPGRTFLGTIRAVDTMVNNETRTLRARIEVPNATGELKPDMYFQATLRVDLGRHVAVPTTALMDSGTRQLVFVQTQPGHFSPREVKVGHSAEEWTEIVSGITEGEVVVTSANFLIDSESKIRGAVQP